MHKIFSMHIYHSVVLLITISSRGVMPENYTSTEVTTHAPVNQSLNSAESASKLPQELNSSISDSDKEFTARMAVAVDGTQKVNRAPRKILQEHDNHTSYLDKYQSKSRIPDAQFSATHDAPQIIAALHKRDLDLPMDLQLVKVPLLDTRKLNYEFLYRAWEDLNEGYGRYGDGRLQRQRFHHREERSDGQTKGQFRLRLPNGRVQIVSYQQMDDEYLAKVAYLLPDLDNDCLGIDTGCALGLDRLEVGPFESRNGDVKKADFTEEDYKTDHSLRYPSSISENPGYQLTSKQLHQEKTFEKKPSTFAGFVHPQYPSVAPLPNNLNKNSFTTESIFQDMKNSGLVYGINKQVFVANGYNQLPQVNFDPDARIIIPLPDKSDRQGGTIEGKKNTGHERSKKMRPYFDPLLRDVPKKKIPSRFSLQGRPEYYIPGKVIINPPMGHTIYANPSATPQTEHRPQKFEHGYVRDFHALGHTLTAEPMKIIPPTTYRPPYFPVAINGDDPGISSSRFQIPNIYHPSNAANESPPLKSNVNSLFRNSSDAHSNFWRSRNHTQSVTTNHKNINVQDSFKQQQIKSHQVQFQSSFSSRQPPPPESHHASTAFNLHQSDSYPRVPNFPSALDNLHQKNTFQSPSTIFRSQVPNRKHTPNSIGTTPSSATYPSPWSRTRSPQPSSLNEQENSSKPSALPPSSILSAIGAPLDQFVNQHIHIPPQPTTRILPNQPIVTYSGFMPSTSFEFLEGPRALDSNSLTRASVNSHNVLHLSSSDLSSLDYSYLNYGTNFPTSVSNHVTKSPVAGTARHEGSLSNSSAHGNHLPFSVHRNPRKTTSVPGLIDKHHLPLPKNAIRVQNSLATPSIPVTLRPEPNGVRTSEVRSSEGDISSFCCHYSLHPGLSNGERKPSKINSSIRPKPSITIDASVETNNTGKSFYPIYPYLSTRMLPIPYPMIIPIHPLIKRMALPVPRQIPPVISYSL
ncbi:uncharacterized protein LOC108682575 [Hyalella azteca]|uniref:Uncharacterized protein LOC108682575 n=1 Tax=Hyalella azteca TaxID=294128 RepID=A0A8B7PP90_HYAAZ|nr:uncharacterized protein LOC108682575 [Hyalella azteca]